MNKLRYYIPIVLFLLLAIISVFLIRPFWIALFLGALLAYVFYPIHQWLTKKVRWQSLSAGLLVALLVVLLVIPAVFLVKGLVQESYVLYISVRQQLAQGIFMDCQHPFCAQISKFVDDPQIQFQIQELTRTATNWIIEKGSSALLSVPRMALGLFVLLFSFYYLLIDGVPLLHRIERVFHSHKKSYEHIVRRLKEILRGVVFGYFLIAFIQGLLGGIGFLIFGLPSPLFWGLIMIFAALIPILGTWIVWLPASLFLFVNGLIQNSQSMVLRGIGLFLYGLLIVSTIDNLLRPKLVGERAKVHPIVILLGTLGGLFVFGPIGVIVGPLVLSLTVVIFELYVMKRPYKR